MRVVPLGIMRAVDRMHLHRRAAAVGPGIGVVGRPQQGSGINHAVVAREDELAAVEERGHALTAVTHFEQFQPLLEQDKGVIAAKIDEGAVGVERVVPGIAAVEEGCDAVEEILGDAFVKRHTAEGALDRLQSIDLAEILSGVFVQDEGGSGKHFLYAHAASLAGGGRVQALLIGSCQGQSADGMAVGEEGQVVLPGKVVL